MEKATHRNHSHSPRTLRKALWDKKAELLIALGINRQGLGDSERKSEEDQVLVCQDEFVRLRLNQVFYGQLCQVESALDRMDLGEYGTCLGCGSLIPLNRLQAVPWARYCLDCQEKASSTSPHEAVGLGARIRTRIGLLGCADVEQYLQKDRVQPRFLVITHH